MSDKTIKTALCHTCGIEIREFHVFCSAECSDAVVDPEKRAEIRERRHRVDKATLAAEAIARDPKILGVEVITGNAPWAIEDGDRIVAELVKYTDILRPLDLDGPVRNRESGAYTKALIEAGAILPERDFPGSFRAITGQLWQKVRTGTIAKLLSRWRETIFSGGR